MVQNYYLYLKFFSMNFDAIANRALNLEPLTLEEGLMLYEQAPTSKLTYIANQLRQKFHPGNTVTWITERNINITNICISGCTFCNFHRMINDEETYTTTFEKYSSKIKAMLELGGSQLLIQGGIHPQHGIQYYCDLFSRLKEEFPGISLHALGTPEIVHIAQRERMTYREVLEKLLESGLDSLPGAGSEILCDHIRKTIQTVKTRRDEWLGVMAEAHKLGMVTTATMMFGHIETMHERIEHLIYIRDLQSLKPPSSPGFKAFIPWPVMSEGTELGKLVKMTPVLPVEYIRTIAISRIILNNISNIQASWQTIGKETAQACLHAGANDLGSIMMDENGCSTVGASNLFTAAEMQSTIVGAGFTPQLRSPDYNFIELPSVFEKYNSLSE